MSKRVVIFMFVQNGNKTEIKVILQLKFFIT